MKSAKKRTTSDGIEILDHVLLKNDPELAAMVDAELKALELGIHISKMRKKAGLTQEQLAKRVGTTGSVISRLEDASYEGHSLKLLHKIAFALDKKIEIKFVNRKSKSA